jgi:hypothetical protein
MQCLRTWELLTASLQCTKRATNLSFLSTRHSSHMVTLAHPAWTKTPSFRITNVSKRGTYWYPSFVLLQFMHIPSCVVEFLCIVWQATSGLDVRQLQQAQDIYRHNVMTTYDNLPQIATCIRKLRLPFDAQRLATAFSRLDNGMMPHKRRDGNQIVIFKLTIQPMTVLRVWW